MTITSPHNDHLKEIRKLAGRKWRDKLRLFVAEGEDLIDAAARAGWEPEALYVAEGSGLAGIPVAPHVLAEVERAVLPRARHLSIRGLQAVARKELLHRDAAAADRRRALAERGADVVVRPLGDGMAQLSAFLPHPLAAAIGETVDRYARMAKADDSTRSIGQLRAGVLTDLVLRPWDSTRPPVTASLTVVAPLDTLVAAAAGQDACDVGHAPSPGV